MIPQEAGQTARSLHHGSVVTFQINYSKAPFSFAS